MRQITILEKETRIVLGIIKDYEGHWAEDTIRSWPDGSFEPEGFVTRTKFVKMVNNRYWLHRSNLYRFY